MKKRKINTKNYAAEDTLQEHQTILTNATVSKVSDFSVLMVVYEKIVFSIFKYFIKMKKYQLKIKLHKNLIK